jgi:hypothetical protein
MTTDPSDALDDDTDAVDDDTAADAAALDAYDLDGDGEISAVEGLRAQIGIVDAELEEKAAEGGITGAIAEVAHKVLDQLDND